MPELADVARAVSHIKTHLVGKTIVRVEAEDDPIIFGKAKTNHKIVKRSLTGKKIVSVGRHGKYIYLIMSRPPHAVLYFGMTGWFMIKNVDTQPYEAHYDWKRWPPAFLKMNFIFDDNETEAAFCDPRRLGRVYVVNCPRAKIRDNPPINQCGPDAVIDKYLITDEWLTKRIEGRSCPIKVLLMDRGVISGLGNWMTDEILFHAKIFPEARSNSLTSEQISNLRCAIVYVCSTAVDLLGILDKMPSDWLIHHRQKKHGLIMENGEPVELTKVGGRTTVYVPSVQKKSTSPDNIEKKRTGLRASASRMKDLRR
ncbi:hypothetical protein KEM54_006817 [Ascosphaera aggregata]|nr:hypothetical protein KEM54_006817 [Ascosphaera aggregata]